MVMSPWEVRPRTSTVSSGSVALSSRLRMCPNPGVHRQPGGGGLGDADLQITHRGPAYDRTAGHLARRMLPLDVEVQIEQLAVP
jgi:hypothetical protein